MLVCGLLLFMFQTVISESVESNEIIPSSTTTSTPPVETNLPQARRAHTIEDRQDDLLPPNSYFPYQSGGGGSYPAPSYGPPTPSLPPAMVSLEFAFDEIVLRCISEEPFDHIVWTRYQCPQQFCFGGGGVHIASGSSVPDPDLYDVHIRGHDGTIISELLIKKPQDEASEGIYLCEAWPHTHGGPATYPAYGPYQTAYNAPKSNVFIIGGNALLETCYCSTFGGGQPSKQGHASKQVNPFSFKPRRSNVTSTSRMDNNSKQLRYNLKYIDNTLYNVDGENVTADFFRPSKVNPFMNSPFHNLTKPSKYTSHFSNPFFQFTGRSNDKFRELFPKFNIRKGRVSNSTSNSTGNSA